MEFSLHWYLHGFKSSLCSDYDWFKKLSYFIDLGTFFYEYLCSYLSIIDKTIYLNELK